MHLFKDIGPPSGCCLSKDGYVNKRPHTDTRVAGHLFTLHRVEATN